MIRDKAGSRLLPLVGLLALSLLVLGALILFWKPPAPIETASGPEPDCQEGDSKACSVDSCSGLSYCIEGRWSACRWDRVCSPGTLAPCLSGGCAYAYKACDECGAGYGPCDVQPCDGGECPYGG